MDWKLDEFRHLDKKLLDRTDHLPIVRCNEASAPALHVCEKSVNGALERGLVLAC